MGCLSIGNKVIITGGSFRGNENQFHHLANLSNSADVMTCNHLQLFTKYFSIGHLPKPVKFHTLTKISKSDFILCGGEDVFGKPSSDVYYGRLYQNGCSEWVRWAKLKSMNTPRSHHCAMYFQNRLVVMGGLSSKARGSTNFSPMKK